MIYNRSTCETVTCDVPQLQPDSVPIQAEHLKGEGHSDGGPVVSREVPVHAEISDHQDLEAVLPLLHGGAGQRDGAAPALRYVLTQRKDFRISTNQNPPTVTLTSLKLLPCRSSEGTRSSELNVITSRAPSVITKTLQKKNEFCESIACSQ